MYQRGCGFLRGRLDRRRRGRGRWVGWTRQWPVPWGWRDTRGRVFEVRDAVFGGQYDDLPGEAMAQGVEGRFLFPGFGFWSGGVGGVLTVGGVASFRHA